jgi:hypothetical protein
MVTARVIDWESQPRWICSETRDRYDCDSDGDTQGSYSMLLAFDGGVEKQAADRRNQYVASY